MLEIKNLHKSFGDNEILKGVSFKIAKGEVKTIIGPSGSGKSTLLRCINCLEMPESGKLILNNLEYDYANITNKDIQNLRKYTGFVFQNYNLFSNMNVIDNVQKPLIIAKNKTPNEAHDIAVSMLEKVGMLDKLNEFPSRLSGGQSQRVSIARALALEPKILFFDEPTSALDPELTGEVLKVIKSLTDLNITMVIVTHEMAFAKEISDRIIFMDKGVIIEDASPDEVFSSDNERTREFLGKYHDVN